MAEYDRTAAMRQKIPPPSRTPPGPLTAEQAFYFWLGTPHQLDDEYDDPASRGDVFARFINMIDSVGYAFVPKAKVTSDG